MVGLSIRPGHLTPQCQNLTINIPFYRSVQTTQWECRASSTVLWKLPYCVPRVWPGLMADPTARSKTSRARQCRRQGQRWSYWGPQQPSSRNAPLHFLWVITIVKREVTDRSSETSFLLGVSMFSVPLLLSVAFIRHESGITLVRTPPSTPRVFTGWIDGSVSLTPHSRLPVHPGLSSSSLGKVPCRVPSWSTHSGGSAQPCSIPLKLLFLASISLEFQPPPSKCL